MSFRLALFGLIAICIGCSKSTTEPPRAEVTGTVTVRGRPLTGGVIAFFSESGFEDSATIDEAGHYKIMAAIGPNKVRIDNRLLRPDKDAAPQTGAQNPGMKSPSGQKGQKGQSPRLKSAPEPAESSVKGTYVPILESYASFDTSGFKYTVEDGPQVKDWNIP